MHEHIPEHYRYTCDGCGRTHQRQTSSPSAPPGWVMLTLEPQTQGRVTRRTRRSKDLCEHCGDAVYDEIYRLLQFLADRGVRPVVEAVEETVDELADEEGSDA